MNGRLQSYAAAAALTLLAAPAFCAEPSPLAEGKTLFEKNCATCHTLERSLVKKTDRAGWEGTIKKMVAAGAKIGETQSGQILGYLTAKSTFETKCNTCHDLAQPLTAIKNVDEWKATVVRMGAMKPGHLAADEAGAITLYLSLVTPVTADTPAAPAAPGYK